MHSERYFYCAFLFCMAIHVNAQGSLNHFLNPSDSFNKHRVLFGSSFAICSYSAFSIGLYEAWYKKTDRSTFHLFNDIGEWKYMDKLGHVYDGYFQSNLSYQGARWAGLSKNKSLWVGVGMAMAFQSTIEMYDGYSKQWGFSIPDMLSNVLGAGFFLAQEMVWKEQKVVIKFSSYPVSYAKSNPAISNRVKDIYGSGLGQRLLKDYNAQTYWLSFNPTSFSAARLKWPTYLNIALGYGTQGLLGAYSNSWVQNNKTYTYSTGEYQRRNQYFLSLDLDWRKIKVKNRFLKASFQVLNIFKIPFPAIEMNNSGNLKFHSLFF